MTDLTWRCQSIISHPTYVTGSIFIFFPSSAWNDYDVGELLFVCFVCCCLLCVCVSNVSKRMTWRCLVGLFFSPICWGRGMKMMMMGTFRESCKGKVYYHSTLQKWKVISEKFEKKPCPLQKAPQVFEGMLLFRKKKNRCARLTEREAKHLTIVCAKTKLRDKRRRRPWRDRGGR